MLSFKTFFENQRREGTKAEKLLGNSAAVNKFAQFYKNHAEDIALIATAGMYEYLSDPKQSISSELLDAYKKGLAEIPRFFELCFTEVETKKQESPPEKDKTP